MVDLPLLSAPSLQQQLVGHPSANMTLEQLERMSAEQKAKTVLVVQDPFTSYYDARVVADFIRTAEKLGRRPVLLPFSPNGKAQHIKGFLNRFAKTAKKPLSSLIGSPRWGCRWWVSIRHWCCVIATNTNWRWANSAAIFMCCWCMNGWRRK